MIVLKSGHHIRKYRLYPIRGIAQSRFRRKQILVLVLCTLSCLFVSDYLCHSGCHNMPFCILDFPAECRVDLFYVRMFSVCAEQEQSINTKKWKGLPACHCFPNISGKLLKKELNH